MVPISKYQDLNYHYSHDCLPNLKPMLVLTVLFYVQHAYMKQIWNWMQKLVKLVERSANLSRF